MISIKYLNRGYDRSMVLLPGWATDHRIFAHLDIEYNYLLPVEFSPFTFESDILKALKKYKIPKVSLFAWSLGAQVASKFASRRAGLIDEIFIVGAKRHYDAEKLGKIKKYLEENKEAYLHRFYADCVPDRGRAGRFTQGLLKAYRGEQDAARLVRTLDYLSHHDIDPEDLRLVKNITIIHGDKDKIAPLAEAIDLKKDIPRARLVIIKGAGHAPFLREDFNSHVW